MELQAETDLRQVMCVKTQGGKKAMNHSFYDREDGLMHCTVCSGAEGSLPTHCPGRKMTEEEKDAVFQGESNFKNGNWLNEHDEVYCHKCSSECGAVYHLPPVCP